MRRARAVIEDERQRLTAEGTEIGAIKTGAMIRSARGRLSRKLGAEVDFFSLGTNDLVQYLLAVDRSNDEVAEWFRSLHPAVLQSIHRAVSAARAAGIPSIVCGEMASGPAYATVLVGLGARELSMTATAIPRVRAALAGVETGAAEEIAGLCMAAATADEAEEIVRVRLGALWPQVFTPKALPAPKAGRYNS